MMKLENITKSYGETILFHNFSYTFEDNCIYAITGPSGCGKTTLLRILAGLDSDYAGQLTYSKDLKLSMVFQEDRLLNHLNVLDNVTLFSKDQKKSMAILEHLGLKEVLFSPLSKLSGGMRRRVAIARAMAIDYDVLLMDEPFSSIDENLKRTIMDMVKQETAAKQVIFVTHNPAEATYLNATLLPL
ncbi:MAG: ATP-binding cassette domain-containing protein [Lachnospiraceae bacterium]|nr:ATP-binding cassette domain-containing protein [Lachnospiraceae bacterium]